MWLNSHLAFEDFEVVIRWTRDYSGKCSAGDEGSDINPDLSTDYTIRGLEENSTYTINVEIVNMANVSATVMTKSAGEKFTVKLVGIVANRHVCMTLYSSLCSSNECPFLYCYFIQHGNSLGACGVYSS